MSTRDWKAESCTQIKRFLWRLPYRRADGRPDRHKYRLSLFCNKSKPRFSFQCLLAVEVSCCLDKTLLFSVVLCKKDVKTEGRPWHLSCYSHLRATAISLFLSVSNIHAGWLSKTENAQLAGNFFFCPSLDQQVGMALSQDPPPLANHVCSIIARWVFWPCLRLAVAAAASPLPSAAAASDEAQQGWTLKQTPINQQCDFCPTHWQQQQERLKEK